MKRLSKGQCLALIIQNNQTKKEYQRQRNVAKHSSNADIYVPYKEVMDYRDKECTPPNIDYSNAEHEIILPMQSANDHQLTKLFKMNLDLQPKMEKCFEENPQADFRVLFKWGMYYVSIKLYHCMHFII